ncbi:methyl-accepting chemotaxis protein [Pseudomonas coleopterorum]|jgi:methyl-accepting chemotaxis protein|uniref:Methyl-accepting chemotaxis protein n=3 Tax=Pseudomonas coleopterorum TaxID=1605838 RepID=A0ABR9BT02_9PSED|nr:methyl-accepting chemotaxis protein [Pseudomonas coleopterorum]MBD8754769.1 methyl-accepting chemotaxis protein [Pseudomonas coleopterorum]MBD8768235.1 methyl-accepting chemotaxis protein [Pseudomonas coleopterorum]
MNLRNFKIAHRSLLCFGVLIALTLCVGLFGLSQLSKIRAQGLALENNSIPSIVEADNLALQLTRMRVEALRLLAMPDAASRAAIVSKLKDLSDIVNAGFKRYEPLLSSDEERRQLEALRQHYADYQRLLGGLATLMSAGQIDQARSVVSDEMAPLGAKMNQTTEALRKINEKAAKDAAVESDLTYSRSQLITGIAITLAILLTLLMAWRLTVSLAYPITQAVQAARTIAEGDLTQTLDARGTDEAAQLLQAMHTMQGNLRETLTHLGHSSTQLASSAEEMSAVMYESAQGLQQQNTEIEMAATAVTEMSQAVEEVASNAASTSAESRKAAETALQGQAQLGATLGAIETLTDNVLDARERAQHLADQTLNISQVLDVIRSVAEQTNLLALNAAIEAARAGDAGRGFAVVADEVRALAHRTSESTREIESLIGSIQNGTARTVDALESSAEQARFTRTQAQSANLALATIAQSVSGIDDLNMVIASAAEEQAQVAREVDRNIVRIRDLSVQTATGSEQTRVASQELSQLAAVLNTQVRRFRV